MKTTRIQPRFLNVLLLTLAFGIPLGLFAGNDFTSLQSYTCVTSDAFITTWKTTSANESITIPTDGLGYQFDVDWGDGTTTTNHTGDASHSYTVAGTYQVSITGAFPKIFFNNGGSKNKIISINQWGDQIWGSMAGSFHGCKNMKMLAVDTPNLTFVISMSKMFLGCKLLNQPMDHWDVSSVEDMSGLFQGANRFNQHLASWNVSQVKNMSAMFQGALKFDQPIGGWDVSSVLNMSGMFQSTMFSQDISEWIVSSVNNMNNMFRSSLFDGDLSDWDVSSVTNMKSMFEYSIFSHDISDWNVSAVKNMNHMFSNCSYNGNITVWDVSAVKDFGFMFFNNPIFNQDIGNWDTSAGTNFTSMFEQCDAFNQDIGHWNVSSAQLLEMMFYASYAFDQNLGHWDISHGPDMGSMFGFSGLSLMNYDSTLIGWAAQAPAPVSFHAGESQYCLAAEAREMLIQTYNWFINDDGQFSPTTLTNIFTNGLGTNLWHEGGNWSLGYAPTNGNVAVVPANQMVMVLNDPLKDLDGTCFELDVKDGGVFIVEEDAVFRVTSPCGY